MTDQTEIDRLKNEWAKLEEKIKVDHDDTQRVIALMKKARERLVGRNEAMTDP
jgi:hypothetical protein